MASLKYEISMLDCNTRFALWQIKMQAVFTQIDLEDALLGIDKMPSTLTDEEKKRKDRKALILLHLYLSNEILQDVMKEKTTAALWKRLEQICMSKTLTSKLHMKQRLYAYCLEEGADTILYSCESLTVDEVYDSLTSYDKMKHLVVKPDSQGKSLIARGRQDRNADNDRGRTQEQNPHGKSKGRSKSSNRGKTCNYCKKKGHIKSKCYKLQNKIKREAANLKGKQLENFSEADVVEDYSDGELLVASDWFTTYETVSEGVVLMGNNASCKIAELKRNLISLSTLDSKGYRYIAESGVLKIFKGSLVVMEGQRKTAKLYVLQGSTVTGDATVASFSLSDDDITKLWHMHLGHMNENGMVELSKRGLLDGQGICKLNFCEHSVLGSKREFDSPKESITRMECWSIFILICGDHPECLREIVQVRWDRETLDSSSYSTVKWHCRMNKQNDHGEGSMYVVKCQLTEVILGRSSACFLINRSLSVAIKKKTPQEVWSGNPTNYSNLKIFGCPAYAHVDNGKLEPRSIKCVFLGYKAGVKGVASSLQYSIAKNQTRREIKPPKKYAEADLVAYDLNVAEDIDANREPSNYSKAISCEGLKKWMFAMQEKMESLHKNRTWDLVKLPKDKKAGYSQIPGVDFTDVFSLVVKHSSIRALLGVVAMHDLELE
ncbi:hypothetical protein CXB51_001184 [Gossypium anomalum]|uniref:GAG-pre-integrase domain-containing protein n=1 Tax=Gossypium anomalum TaxID=47600 RepID=A0A8J5ZJW5_9ROSI|nr:hypothetical protein CXB51_001184 [Gossypium anomalum]